MKGSRKYDPDLTAVKNVPRRGAEVDDTLNEWVYQEKIEENELLIGAKVMERMCDSNLCRN